MNDPTTYTEFTYNAQQCIAIAEAAKVNDFKVSSVLLVIAATEARQLFRLETVDDCLLLATLVENVIEAMQGDTAMQSKKHIAEWLKGAMVLR